MSKENSHVKKIAQNDLQLAQGGGRRRIELA
jgi:hypothetical protein